MSVRAAAFCGLLYINTTRLIRLPGRYNAPADDSPEIDLSFTEVVINYEVDKYRPDISGEIHPVYFILFPLKEQLLWPAKLSNAGP